jgi:SecD/SecF fusion protein
MLSIVRNPKVPFLNFRKPAFAISWCVVLIGVAGIYTKWDTIFGIDFTGGDEVSLAYESKIDESEINRIVVEQELGEVTPQYVTPLGGGVEVLKLQTPFEESPKVLAALKAAFPQANFEAVGTKNRAVHRQGNSEECHIRDRDFPRSHSTVYRG